MKIDRIVVVKKCGEIKVIIINKCWKWNLRKPSDGPYSK